MYHEKRTMLVHEGTALYLNKRQLIGFENRYHTTGLVLDFKRTMNEP